MEPLLSLRLSASYRGREVLRDVAFEILPGEILGLAGESGAGKSTIALAILNLLRFQGGAARGEVRFGGRNLLECPEREMRAIRGRAIALVPQSPVAALNPALRLGAQFAECWHAHARGPAKVMELLESVSLPPREEFLRRYPGELSVGMAQRVLIAMALLHGPSLIVADEPTSALDAITQTEILALFENLNRRTGVALLYISHDLLSMAALCGRIAVLYEGGIAESAAAEELFRAPRHPYTQRLVAALPRRIMRS